MQRAPLDPTCRRLIAAVILRAVRDLREPACRYEALWWLRGEGRALGELIGIDVDVDAMCRDKKGQGRWQS